MAKIKSSVYRIGGKEYVVSITCSSYGMFSFKAPMELVQIVSDLKSIEPTGSLDELERKLREAVNAYVNSERYCRLVVAITFKARGPVCSSSKDGGIADVFVNVGSTKGKFSVDRFDCSLDGSVLNIDYKVLIEESIGDAKTYHETYDLRKLRDRGSVVECTPAHLLIDDFAGVRQYRLKDDALLLPYSEELMASLDSIEDQLRKAAHFLATLLLRDDVGKILSSSNVKLLEK